MYDMLLYVTLSPSNYDALLVGWNNFTSLQSGVVFSGGNSKYSPLSALARQNLINTYSWTITDGGLAPSINIDFEIPTQEVGNHFKNNIKVNISASTTGTLDGIIIYLYNSTGLVTKNTSSSSPFYWDITGLDFG
ncbi:MAG: hypothetical protein L3J79_12490, partial [Candidatus Marinimicrobia bacterium]|nr:hypothetical protein [Candidatus Neomarinimicrobiota bacterium]